MVDFFDQQGSLFTTRENNCKLYTKHVIVMAFTVSSIGDLGRVDTNMNALILGQVHVCVIGSGAVVIENWSPFPFYFL